ncbi:MAG: transposase, partial [Methanobacteriota archaeon]
AADDVRNTTDLDSRIMKNRHEGYLQGYNAQAAVDTKTGLLVACDVTNAANDKHQLNPMLDAVHETMGAYPKRAVLDAGYWGEEEVLNAPDGVDLFIAVQKDRDQRRDEEPAPRGRIPLRLSLRERMERRLRTKKGRAVYKLRGTTIEPRFGCIKEAQGIRGFLLRGIEKVRAEWRLIAMSHNVLRLWRLQAA